MVDQRFLPETTTNPWPRFRRKKDRAKPGEQERGFTTEELKAIFAEPIRRDVRDAALMGALTGARIEEIAALKVSDVDLKAMTLHLPGTKTDAAERTTPLHPSLKTTFEGRMKGKEKAAWVFDELPERKDGDPKGRSTVISKAFTRHRRSAGVDGKRRALTNFHSFRRWFITEAERAGAPPHVIMSIVGHKRPGMTLGVYSGGPDLESQMRAVFEAVKLPARVL
jgi:integrase